MDLQQLQIERQPKARTRPRGSRWPLRLGLLALVGLLVWLLGPAFLSWSDRLRLPVVKTMVLRPALAAAAAAQTGTAANGYIVAARRAALSSDVPGRIVALHVTEGSVVKRGDIVAKLFSDEFRAAHQRAEADLAVAAATVERAARNCDAALAEARQFTAAVTTQQALLAEAKAQLAWSTAEWTRVDDLVQRGISSPRDRDRARADLDATQARVDSLDAALRSATAANETATARAAVAASEQRLAEAQATAAAATVQQAKATLDKTDVRAPFDGVVVLKDAEVGEVVSPNVQGGNNARGAVCTMVDFASLEVQANVPETTLAVVQVGAPASVFVDAFPDQQLRGRVDRIWPTADRQKATVEVRIALLDRPDTLRPEMGVRIVFGNQTAPPSADAPTSPAAAAATLLVPESALVEASGRTGAFVLERDTVQFVELRLGERKGGRAAVEQGLRSGQVLVVDPPTTLAHGDRVRVTDGGRP